MRRLMFLAFVCIAAFCSGSATFAGAIATGGPAVVQRVTPAVVSIATWKIMPANQPGGPSRLTRFFGTGFIIDPSGVIATNRHVIDGAIDIQVVLTDGTQLTAKLVAASSLMDLAAVRVEAGRQLPTLAWGDSDALRLGDPVLTVGNGMGLGIAVSAGIVSALTRNIQDTPFDSYIQTDATINHGNSGGPMIDLDGDVVGVNTAMYNPSSTGGFIGIGFAIPANAAQFVIKSLLDPNRAAPGWLGFSLQDMTGALAQAMGAPGSEGAVVSTVDKSGPAAQASLRSGDVLKQLNGQNLNDARAFMRAIALTPIAQTVRLMIWRDGKEQEVSLTVAAWPNLTQNAGATTGQPAATTAPIEPHPGVTLAALTDANRKQYGLSADQTGALITSVEPGSELEALGIQPGNVVIAVEQTQIATPDQVWGIVKEAYAQRRPALAVLIKTSDNTIWIPVSISLGK